MEEVGKIITKAEMAMLGGKIRGAFSKFHSKVITMSRKDLEVMQNKIKIRKQIVETI